MLHAYEALCMATLVEVRGALMRKTTHDKVINNRNTKLQAIFNNGYPHHVLCFNDGSHLFL